MKTVSGIILLIISLFTTSVGTFFGEQTSDPSAQQKAAFEVLEQHCNECHRKDRPRRVFTLDNMTDFAPKIYRQVFVAKRMPKGKEQRERMTPEELETLRIWVEEARK